MGYELFASAFVLTLPFGAWRATTRKLSLRWFLAIHLPIPFIFLLRHEAGYSYTFIPWMVIACVTAQILGAEAMSRWRAAHQSRARMTGGGVAGPSPTVNAPANDASASARSAGRRA